MALSFSIKFPIEPFKIIDEKSRIFLLGSCFTEHIGNKLIDSGFQTAINPFGILFNPVSICNSIERIINKEVYSEKDLYRSHENRFVSFDHHGRFSGSEADKVVSEINASLLEAYKNLKTSECLIITLGSAWVYRHLEQNRIVANCHKVPNSEFRKELQETENIAGSLTDVISKIKTFNPKIKIIFTISPVKHLRDGVVQNQQSKAVLILAIAKLLKRDNENIYYFPAYEIVTDELRDYRFFENDHSHPNQLAIDYVWERFMETCFTEKAIEKVKEAEALNKALSHRTLHTESLNENLSKKINTFLKKFPLT